MYVFISKLKYLDDDKNVLYQVLEKKEAHQRSASLKQFSKIIYIYIILV